MATNKNNDWFQHILDYVSGLLPSETTHYGQDSSGRIVPMAQAAASQPSISPSPSPVAAAQQASQAAPVDNSQIAQQILQGYRKYSGGKPVPMEQYIPQMVEAAQKYPVFQKNPYLIPAVSIVETSAGQNWKLNHNPLSWAARVQQAGQYNPSSDSQSIGDMITAVGGDPNRGAGFDPETAKIRQAGIAPYQKFRDSNNLYDFATTYEDKSNQKYYPALQQALQYFQGGK